MKSVETLSKDFEKWADKLTNNLIKAHDETADDVLNDVKRSVLANNNVDTGEFYESLDRTPTMLVDGHLITGIGSNLLVTTKDGKSYKLGQLLETGTDPHAIPNAFGWGDIYGYDSEQYLRTTQSDWHPGTIAYNNYKNALDNNEQRHRERLAKAIQEAFK